MPATPERESPYQDLVPFKASDAPFFFGRKTETHLIVASLFAAPLTVLYGASGVGKSSVLGAGVCAQLQDRSDLCVIKFDTWQGNPANALKVQIAAHEAWKTCSTGPPPDSQPLLEFLTSSAERLERRLMIILDQFEEYFLYQPLDEAFGEQFPEAVIQCDGLISFLISIREDAVAKLDRFEGRIPSLLDNWFRLEHLDHEAARAAIVEPIKAYCLRYFPNEDPVRAEPELVEAVLKQVERGRVTLGETGQGKAKDQNPAHQIEAPFLQLVMTRVWLREIGSGSRWLRLTTLTELGGAEQIVRAHLDNYMNELPAAEQELAARIFNHLVTPSGTKIAQSSGDLAKYAESPESPVQGFLEKLARSEVRILRTAPPPLGQPGLRCYEIFHDVLAPAILAWRQAYVQVQKLCKARVRQLFVTLLLLASFVTIGSAVLAYEKTKEAKRQSRIAFSRELSAHAILQLPRDPELSVLLAAAAVEVSANNVDALEALRRSLLESNLRALTKGPPGFVNGSAFSPDGKLLLAAEGNLAWVWDWGSRQKAAEFRGHSSNVTSAAFSLDGRFAVTASEDMTARVWNSQTGALLAELKGHLRPVNTAFFSQDGQFVVTGSDDQTARVWKASTGKEMAVMKPHPLAVASALFSPDGKFIITIVHDRVPRVWDAQTGNLVRELAGHDNDVDSAAFSPHGEWVVTASVDNEAWVWETKTWQAVAKLKGHADDVTAAAFSSDSQFVVTASEDHKARVWDWRQSQVVTILSGHTKAVTGASFSPDGKFVATASQDGEARVWEVASMQTAALLKGQRDALKNAVFSPDGLFVATSGEDRMIRVWDARTGKAVTRNDGPINSASFSHDGRLVLTASNDRIAHIIDVRTGATLVLRGHMNAVNAATFSLDDRLVVTASDDNTARVWETRTGNSMVVLQGHTNRVNSGAFSPDGEFVVTASKDRTARIWNARTGRQVAELRQHTNSVTRAMFSPNGRLIVTGSDDETAILWNSINGTMIASLRGHTAPILGVAFSPDNQWIVTCGDNTPRVWDAQTGRKASELNGHDHIVQSAVFSPDSKLIITAGWDQQAKLWEAPSGKLRGTLIGHAGPVMSAVFSPDGRFVVTSSHDETARLWEVRTQRSLAILHGHTGMLTSASFSPDGKSILSSSQDGTARIYACAECGGGRELLALARQRLTRDLAQAERELFLHEPRRR